MVFVDTHTVVIHCICIEALKITGSTLQKCLYIFSFWHGLKILGFVESLCGILSEEGKGFSGLLANCVKPHNSIALRTSFVAELPQISSL